LIRQFEDAVIGLVQAGGDQSGVILLRGDGVADKQGADFLAGFGGGFGHCAIQEKLKESDQTGQDSTLRLP
jgi:hypothetical protein